MLVKEFRQKKGFKYRNFVLYSDRINVEIKTTSETARYDVKLEELGFELHYHTAHKSKLQVYIFCGVMLSLMATILIMDEKREDTGAVVFLGLILIIISITGFLTGIVDDIYLVGGPKKLLFFRNTPNEASVLEFIDTIKETQTLHYKTKYTFYNSRTIHEEYVSRLLWLKDTEVINEDEYGQLLHNFEISRLLE